MKRPSDSDPEASSVPRNRFLPAPVHGLNIGERDRDLLAHLYLHQAMSRGQLQTLHFGSVARCNSRLRQLFDHGFVTRWYPPMAPFGGQAVYGIGRAAVPVVALRLEIDEDEVRRTVRSRTPTFMEHTLAIVDFHIAVRGAAAHAGIEVETWLPEMLCRHEYDLLGGREAVRKEAFKPDAFFRLAISADIYASYFVDIDLGHTSSRQFSGKLATHQRYLDSGLFAEIYGCASFATLVVTTSNTRLLNLTALAEEHGSSLFWFTTFDAVRASGPLAPIWRVPLQEGAIGIV